MTREDRYRFLPEWALAGALAAHLVLGACYTMQSRVDYERDVDFSRYRSFSLARARSPDESFEDPSLRSRSMTSRLPRSSGS